MSIHQFLKNIHELKIFQVLKILRIFQKMYTNLKKILKVKIKKLHKTVRGKQIRKNR